MSDRRSKSRWANVRPTDVPTLGQRWPNVGMLSGLQWEVMKVKFLINSNMTLTVLNLHQKRDPKVQQDFIGQGHYDKVKGQIKVTP